jgi:hypothetical protein
MTNDVVNKSIINSIEALAIRLNYEQSFKILIYNRKAAIRIL